MKSEKLSIKTATSVIAAITAIIVVIYVTYLSHENFKETIISQTQEQLLETIKATGNGLEEFISEHLKILKLLSDNSYIQKEISEGFTCEKFDIEFCPIRNFYQVHKS